MRRSNSALRPCSVKPGPARRSIVVLPLARREDDGPVHAQRGVDLAEDQLEDRRDVLVRADGLLETREERERLSLLVDLLPQSGDLVVELQRLAGQLVEPALVVGEFTAQRVALSAGSMAPFLPFRGVSLAEDAEDPAPVERLLTSAMDPISTPVYIPSSGIREPITFWISAPSSPSEPQ